MLPAAILAGGLATRLRPITEKIPKALVPINGEPFLAHQLRLLRHGGFSRVVICAGYLGEMIREFAASGSAFGLQVEYCFDGEKLLGTAGALKRALPQLGEAFFVIYGDSYLPCDYAGVERSFLDSGKQSLMTVYRNEGLFDTSNVEFSSGRILRYDKKNRTTAMRHIDYGLGAFRASAFDEVAKGEVADLAALYQTCLAKDELAAHEVADRFYEVGSPQGIADLERYLASTSGE